MALETGDAKAAEYFPHLSHLQKTLPKCLRRLPAFLLAGDSKLKKLLKACEEKMWIPTSTPRMLERSLHFSLGKGRA